MGAQSAIRFAVIGLNHGHVYGMTEMMLQAGAECVSFYAEELALISQFSERYPEVTLARTLQEIWEDRSIHLILSAAIPSERAGLGIATMQHGKDFLSDKPAFTTMAQLEEARRVQRETGRIFSIWYGERLANRATVRAGELVKAGAIGQVVQTIGLGPHLIRLSTRPSWFFQQARYGGILTDIGSHQMDQFLYFTDSSQAEIVASQVGNFNYPQYPELEDFGDAMVKGDKGVGYCRVDWYTPLGVGTYGDGRLIVIGTAGYIEVRKTCDIGGRSGGDHLFLVDDRGVHYEDCSQEPLPFAQQLLADVANRTETAMSQTHCFLASELALQAQAQATRLGHLK